MPSQSAEHQTRGESSILRGKRALARNPMERQFFDQRARVREENTGG